MKNNGKDYYAPARTARLSDAQIILRLFSLTFFPLGWLVSGHGSTFVIGEGRDVDLVFNCGSAEAIPKSEVLARLQEAGLQVITADEYRSSRASGVIGMFGGLALDISFFENPPSEG